MHNLFRKNFNMQLPKPDLTGIRRSVRVDRIIDYYEEGDQLGDGIYTHDFVCFRTFYLTGKIIHDTEARVYFWDGNREILDLKKVFKIHHMQKRKIDKMAEKCSTKAKYFTIAAIH